MTTKLGIDIGGVIVRRVNDGSETSFYGERFLENQPIAGAFEGIRQLVDSVFGESVYLVSRCRDETRRRTIAWLDHYDFWNRCAVAPANVHFCLERHEKDAICAQLGVSHFVDDHIDVLRQLPSVANRYLFQPDDDDRMAASGPGGGLIVVEDWPSAVAAVRFAAMSGAR